MFCINCGKEIEDNAIFCPECGAPQKGTTPMSSMPETSYNNSTNQPTFEKAPYNLMCIVGLVISAISLLLNFWGLVGIAGTIVSVIGLNSCTQKNENGKSLAIIGIAIGIFSIFYAIFTLLIL